MLEALVGVVKSNFLSSAARTTTERRTQVLRMLHLRTGAAPTEKEMDFIAVAILKSLSWVVRTECLEVMGVVTVFALHPAASNSGEIELAKWKLKSGSQIAACRRHHSFCL